MHRWIAAVSALALSCAPAFAIEVNRAVPVGGALKGIYYLAINPDCSIVDYPTVRIVSPPSSGVASVTRGKAFPSFPPFNPRSACNRRRVPAMLLRYQPERGFIGNDSFSVDVIYPAGAEQSITYNITVK
jgi:hypothetical protein